jgi:peptidyl-tRNA hydrolase
MFKKTMTFDDLEGNEVSQTFYFNYNKKEVAELLEFKQLEEKLKLLTVPIEESGLTQVENNQQAYDIFQDLILDAYGEKGADNVTFVKNERTREYFRSHVAFVELIFEFLENPKLAGEFIEKCLPQKLVARAKEEIAAKEKGKLSSSTLAEMVQEADRRQQDPETRIEPGLGAAQEAEVAPIVTDGLTDEEILGKKPQDLSKPQLLRAMELKSRV